MIEESSSPSVWNSNPLSQWNSDAGSSGVAEPMLEGVRVVEAGEWLMVPAASNVLAQWGADVVKVEHPIRGDPMRSTLQATGSDSPFNFYQEQPNHSKRSVGIDLSQPKGREILLALIAEADVFVTSFRESARRRWGITYDDLASVNPRLIYARSHGQGQRGPEADHPGFDAISYWARGGLSYTVTPFGDTNRLMPAGGFGDQQGGFALAAGIAAALYRRTVSGRGGIIDVSLLGVAVWAMYESLEVAHIGETVPRSEFRAPNQDTSPRRSVLLYMRNPLGGIYPVGQTDSIALLMPHSDRYWPQFCLAVSRPDLTEDPAYSSFEARDTNCEALAELIRDLFSTWSVDEVVRRLEGAGCPHSRCQSPLQIVADPQVRANGYLMPHPNDPQMFVVANPVQYNNGMSRVRCAAPEVGQQTEEVLLGLGYSWEDITALKETKTIT